jgi:fumarylacetoacetase
MSFGDHFSIANLPYGIASLKTGEGKEKAVVTRLGDLVIFLAALNLDVSDEIKQALNQASNLIPLGLTYWQTSALTPTRIS